MKISKINKKTNKHDAEKRSVYQNLRDNAGQMDASEQNMETLGEGKNQGQLHLQTRQSIMKKIAGLFKVPYTRGMKL